MDVVKVLVWGDFNEVGFFEVIWNYFIDIMWKV